MILKSQSYIFYIAVFCIFIVLTVLDPGFHEGGGGWKKNQKIIKGTWDNDILR